MAPPEQWLNQHPRSRRNIAASLGFSAAVFLFAATGNAANNSTIQKNLDRLEQEITDQEKQQDNLAARRRSIGEETASLRARLIGMAQQAQDLEGVVTSLDTELTSLKSDIAGVTGNLTARRRQINASMAILQRIALRPSVAAYFSTENAADTANAAALMARIVPALGEEARRLGSELNKLKTLRARLESRRNTRMAAVRNLKTERDRLDSLIDNKKHLQADISDRRRAADKRIDKLSARAKSLRDLITALSKEPGKKPTARPVINNKVIAYLANPDLARLNKMTFSKARGQLLPPARGKVTVRYGESIGPAATSKGVTFLTGDNARIIAPFAGEVLYAGKFRGYGHLLIISHGEGYHGLIAGLNRIDVEVGHNLLAGEPVGIMGHPRDGANNLYFEIRQSGKSVNPLPWLAASGRIDTG